MKLLSCGFLDFGYLRLNFSARKNRDVLTEVLGGLKMANGENPKGYGKRGPGA
ncbi:hypothetical protein BH11PLA2_BH11PLA2_51200 [soil metagenome]